VPKTVENGDVRLLHQFLQKRPKSKEEWIRTTPYEIRSIIDSRQVKEYLERILSIIARI